jgi:multiple antibiotic resistance protein
MDSYPFVFTILFMLLGPLKVIGPFASVTRERDDAFVRSVAISATLASAAILAFIALAAGAMLGKFHLSLPSLKIAGGLVLLIAALRTMFGESALPDAGKPNRRALSVAVSPITVPIIVPPAGVAALLILAAVAPELPGVTKVMAISLAIIVGLNFLVMFFNRVIVGWGPLMLVLQLIGAVLVFIQAALAVDTMLMGFKDLGVFRAAVPL